MQQQTGGLLNISEAPMARPDYSAQQADLPLTQVEQDAYDKKMSVGGSALDQFLGSLLLGDSPEALRQAAIAERNKRNPTGE